MELDHIYSLPPNRVRRNYHGGFYLDVFDGIPDPDDGDFPEDWLASTTPASNPGMQEITNEGLATVLNQKGQTFVLKTLLEKNWDFFLGQSHYENHGAKLGFLAKLLDSSIRLHVQAHPTAEFARRWLSSRWGKMETYVILGVRPGVDGYIRLGFQRPPSLDEWKRIVYEQDISAMDSCFDKIPVHPGEIWQVPGGFPHAIGEGLLVLEVMEPTDLVVRCEFQREGIAVPPEARFVGMTPEQAFDMFDYSSRSISEIRQKCCLLPKLLLREHDLSLEQIIGKEQTDCFCVYRTKITQSSELSSFAKITVCVVAKGTGEINVNGQVMKLKPGVRFLLPAGVQTKRYTPEPGEELEILSCTPG